MRTRTTKLLTTARSAILMTLLWGCGPLGRQAIAPDKVLQGGGDTTADTEREQLNPVVESYRNNGAFRRAPEIYLRGRLLDFVHEHQTACLEMFRNKLRDCATSHPAQSSESHVAATYLGVFALEEDLPLMDQVIRSRCMDDYYTMWLVRAVSRLRRRPAAEVFVEYYGRNNPSLHMIFEHSIMKAPVPTGLGESK